MYRVSVDIHVFDAKVETMLHTMGGEYDARVTDYLKSINAKPSLLLYAIDFVSDTTVTISFDNLEDYLIYIMKE